MFFSVYNIFKRNISLAGFVGVQKMPLGGSAAVVALGPIHIMSFLSSFLQLAVLNSLIYAYVLLGWHLSDQA